MLSFGLDLYDLIYLHSLLLFVSDNRSIPLGNGSKNKMASVLCKRKIKIQHPSSTTFILRGQRYLISDNLQYLLNIMFDGAVVPGSAP